MSFINITSERMSFELIQISDLENIHELHSLPETDKYNTLGIPKNIDVTRKTILPWIHENEKLDLKNYTIKINRKEDGVFLGLFGLKLSNKKYNRAEVWYKLHSNYWNKGYGTEALKRIIDFGFNDLQLHRIQAGCAVDNIPSIKLLEKVGMLREGRGRQVLPLTSGWSDNFEYALLSSDWKVRT